MAEAKLFHIETVTVEMLKTIHGIGDVRAEAIISVRSRCGGVMTAEQFAEVEIPDSVKQEIVSTGIIQFSDGDVSSGQDVVPCDGQVQMSKLSPKLKVDPQQEVALPLTVETRLDQMSQRLDNTVKSLDEMKKGTESIDHKMSDFMNKIRGGFQTKCEEAIKPVAEKCDVVELEQKVDKNQDNVQSKISDIRQEVVQQLHDSSKSSEESAKVRELNPARNTDVKPKVQFADQQSMENKIDRLEKTLSDLVRGLNRSTTRTQQPSVSQMACYECGERGHFSRDCPRGRYSQVLDLMVPGIGIMMDHITEVIITHMMIQKDVAENHQDMVIVQIDPQTVQAEITTLVEVTNTLN